MNTAYIGMQDYKDLLDIRTEKYLMDHLHKLSYGLMKNQYGYYFTEVLDYKTGIYIVCFIHLLKVNLEAKQRAINLLLQRKNYMI